MAPRVPGDTTIRSPTTEVEAATGSAAAIRWVFPRFDAALTSLAKLPVQVGRAPDCHASLPSSEVSRYHAEIRREGSLRIIRDLDSTNGVSLNGVQTPEAPLTRGDLLRLGDWIGIVVEKLQGEHRDSPSYMTLAPGLFGGPVLGAAIRPATLVAKTDLPIIIEGETGTGKEGVARAIHGWSERPGPFLAINCAALPDELAEAELFGYRRGAFTGADRPSLGHFRAADGGTILLDEITDLPLALQAKLLRVLEQHEVLPLGESRPISVNVRVLAATQGPLSQAVAEHRFRADLHARLDGLTVRLPPLRERAEEIPYLWTRLLLYHSGDRSPEVEARLVEQLCLYDWPYNVRELELLCRRMLAMHGNEPVLRRSHLPERIRSAKVAAGAPTEVRVAPGPTTDELSVAALLAALRATKGNVKRAAAQLGVTRQRVYRMMELCEDEDLAALRERRDTSMRR